MLNGHSHETTIPTGSTETGSPPKLPVATAVALVVTSVTSILGFLYPGILDALRRDPSALLAAEWWRVLTPLLVQSDGWWQFALNTAGLAVVGTAVERRFGARRWLALYLAGGIAGQLVGYAWQPHGAGNSVAVLGLAGGLVVLLLRGDDRVPPVATLFVLYLVAALVGWAAGGVVAAVVLCVLVGGSVQLLAGRDGAGPTPPVLRLVGFAILLGTLLLTALRDNHGPAILAGACAAFVLWRFSGAATRPDRRTP